MLKSHPVIVVWSVVLLILVNLGGSLGAGGAKVRRVPYHAWNEALVLSNEKVEAILVPEVGRVMQFRFAGEEDGPFWENRALDGKAPNSQSSEWINFGGDKTWPAPQADWEKITGRGWPPPQAFDSLSVAADIAGDAVIFTSKVDPNYGIQTVRKIRLTGETTMEIETTYKKIQGSPVPVGIWVITQLKNPEQMFMPVPRDSTFPAGYNKQSEILPAELHFKDGLVTCTRSSKNSTKIGSDAGRLIWADQKHLIEIVAPREKSGTFPDHGSSAEIYTNPDPNQYVEFELLGPLATLTNGDSISRKQSYTLFKRDQRPLASQVEALLKK